MLARPHACLSSCRSTDPCPLCLYTPLRQLVHTRSHTLLTHARPLRSAMQAAAAQQEAAQQAVVEAQRLQARLEALHGEQRSMRAECAERWSTERAALGQVAGLQERAREAEAAADTLRARLAEAEAAASAQQRINLQLMQRKEEVEWQLMAALAKVGGRAGGRGGGWTVCCMLRRARCCCCCGACMPAAAQVLHRGCWHATPPQQLVRSGLRPAGWMPCLQDGSGAAPSMALQLAGTVKVSRGRPGHSQGGSLPGSPVVRRTAGGAERPALPPPGEEVVQLLNDLRLAPDQQQQHALQHPSDAGAPSAQEQQQQQRDGSSSQQAEQQEEMQRRQQRTIFAQLPASDDEEDVGGAAWAAVAVAAAMTGEDHPPLAAERTPLPSSHEVAVPRQHPGPAAAAGHGSGSSSTAGMVRPVTAIIG